LLGATSKAYRKQSDIVPWVILAMQKVGEAQDVLLDKKETRARAIAMETDRSWPV
jgi:hypothetical protein